MADPDDSMNAALVALQAGDIFTAMGFLTPEVINEAMSANTGAGIASLPTLTGYNIESQDEQDGTHNYRVRLQTSEGDVHALVAWREVDGYWRITALSIVPPAA